MGSRRATVAIAGAVALVVVAVLVWRTRGGSEEGASESPPATVTAARPPSQPAPRPPALPSVATPAPDPVAQPQPVAVDPSAHPPALDAPVSKPAPPQVPFTPAEIIAKREADLKLLDATHARLERELAAARTANNATSASELEIRIARLVRLREQRSGELERLRAGGTVAP